ncbi:MAG: enoyl-CoA hydratase/isomerase family protein, partial [Zoogloeaceae bacterium]|nr:enoyl-CoA hydratase/isomerase family protein [Zoogloeaceae bacterium]
EAVTRAERDLDGLVIWHDAPFAVGANLQEVVAACQAGQFERLDKTVVRFQGAAMAIKHAQVPVVAAVQGMALGGGCEFALHAAHRVFALESYVGLVEAGVGLIPSGGGSKELALRAAAAAQATAGGDVFPFIQPLFETIAMAKVSKSATQAVRMGFGQGTDDIIFHSRELLHVALARTRALAESAYRPPVVQSGVKVAGRTGIANCEMMLTNMQEGGYISAHDYRVAKAAATALCGGEVDANTQVPEQWLLDVERSQFLDLLNTPETQARIVHMLETGKPLRN